MTPFRDRREAGHELGRELARFAREPDLLILGLPRGGVPVAFEVARALHAPLDVFLVRKLGVPGQEELAMGAIASGGVRVVNEEVVGPLEIGPEVVERVAEQEGRELARRERLYRGERSYPPLEGRTVILVDDGLATGASMRAAVGGVRARRPVKVVVAVPTGAAETCQRLAADADAVVCLRTPEPFFGVGAWYQDFSQTTDEEVRDLLDRAGTVAASPETGGPGR